jgi:endoribonuclease LACTB2
MFEVRAHGSVTQFKVGNNHFGRTFFKVCFYHIDGMLIDTGHYGCKGVYERISQNYQLNQAVVTHHHEDHTGNGCYFSKRGLPVWAHKETIRILNNESRKLPLYRRSVWKTPPPFEMSLVDEKIQTEHHTFQVIHTPGHTPDHICLYEEKEGWLFTGDHFLSEQVKIAGREENFTQVIASLQKIKQLDLTTIYCSLGRIVTNPQQAIDEKIEFMLTTQEKIQVLSQQGYKIPKITKMILGTDWLGKFLTRGDFCKENLVKAALE